MRGGSLACAVQEGGQEKTKSRKRERAHGSKTIKRIYYKALFAGAPKAGALH
jgi:hypothetical protein